MNDRPDDFGDLLKRHLRATGLDAVACPEEQFEGADDSDGWADGKGNCWAAAMMMLCSVMGLILWPCAAPSVGAH